MMLRRRAAILMVLLPVFSWPGVLRCSQGVPYVLVSDEFVIWDGEPVGDARPGQAILVRKVIFQGT